MHEDCTPTHGYAAPREAAMAAFAKKLAVQVNGRPASSLARSGATKLRCPCAANKR
jgi:hypothetical protein